MNMLTGKNAIVTGARTGIGKAIVYKFAQSGANIWAVVHREDQEWLEEMQMLGMVHNVWIRPVYIDLSDESSIAAGVKSIIAEKQPIDILVNAAGVVSPSRLFTMTPMDEMRHVMQVNYFAAIQMSQLVSRVMMRQKNGNIVHIASISAWGEDTSQLEYATSKAALICATKKMARELGQFGIRVNAVAPGLTNTKMINDMKPEALMQIKNGMALHRFGEPNEIAEAVCYLSCERSSFITGETIRVDGGGMTLG